MITNFVRGCSYLFLPPKECTNIPRQIMTHIGETSRHPQMKFRYNNNKSGIGMFTAKNFRKLPPKERPDIPETVIKGGTIYHG